MRKALSRAIIALFPAIGVIADSAPALQWVKKLGGSGFGSIAGTAADASGNFYIVGTTTSIDMPTAAATQLHPGGSPLVRINTGTGAADKLYPPGLSAVNCLAADPGNPRTLYAATATGIFQSPDTGATWTPLAQAGPNATVRFLAVDPSNGNTLYAALSGPGVLKSVDRGVTWSPINSGITVRPEGTVNAFNIWIDPNTPQVLFTNTDYGGLFRSADGGASWTMITTPAFSALAFDPFVTGAIYMGTPSEMFLKSTDDGQTFTPLSQPPKPVLISTLIADPLHPGVLFAGSFVGGIFQSVDSGSTWTQKSNAQVARLAADPNHPVIYANAPFGLIASTDGFNTTTPVGPPETGAIQIFVAGPNLFELTSPTKDVLAVKLDTNGNIVYATYFGGSTDDSASAMALGADGSLYITGATRSIDFPTTEGAYARTLPGSPGAAASFLFKLNPDGSLAWSTYFSDFHSTTSALAVDNAGNPFIGGFSGGNLPTTPGVYQTQFTQTQICTGFIGCFPGATAAFVTKFNGQGSRLLFSTYVPADSQKHLLTVAQALAVDSGGNVYFGGPENVGLVSGGTASSGQGNVSLLNSTGSALLASVVQPGVNTAAMVLDSTSNLYVTGSATPGSYSGGVPTYPFPATPGAFQQVPQPAIPLAAGATPGGGTDAFVIKWDRGLTKILAATLLGGESADIGESIAVDPAGNVILSGETDSKAFPTHAPFQASFAVRSGFVAGFDPTLSQLRFSTFIGDEHPFDAHAAALDGQGNLLLAGSTVQAGSFPGGLVVANKIALPAPPAVRLDSVVNAASRIAMPIAPGEPIAALGSGFGPNAQLVIDGAPLAPITATATSVVARMPDSAKTAGVFVIQVRSGGAPSNAIAVPAAPASPGIYSVDGSGFGQGYILNSDGTMNSPANPAAPGSAITIFAAGAGAFTLDHGYALTALAPSVYIGGFYADGIGAFTGPVAGLPGDVFQLSVYVPDPAQLASRNPDLKNFKFAPQVNVRLVMGPVSSSNPISSAMVSQSGLILNIQQ